MSLRAESPVRVLVVDDSDECRRALCAVVAATSGFDLVGEAASGEEALALLARTAPQLVLLDVRLPGLDGIQTARLIREASGDVSVVLLSASGHLDGTENSPPILDKHEVTPRLLADVFQR